MPMVKKPETGTATEAAAPVGITTKPPTAPVEKHVVGSGDCDKPAPTKYGKPLGAYELETDRRIHVSGLMQAVAASPALVPFILKQEDYSKVVIEETRKLLKAAHELVEKGA